MITPEQSEQVRKKMEVISSRINDALDSHSSHSRPVGIKHESNPDDRCPRCGSGLSVKWESQMEFNGGSAFCATSITWRRR